MENNHNNHITVAVFISPVYNKKHIYDSYNHSILIAITTTQFTTLCTLLVNTKIHIVNIITVTTIINFSLNMR